MNSYTKIPNEMLNASQLTIPARYLYCVLLRYCGKDDHCFPSQKTLAKGMEITDRYIRKLLIQLEDAGIITRRRLGYNRSNTYTVSKSLIQDRNGGSYHLGSMFPLDQRTPVPDKTTYIKGKGKTSVKGFEKYKQSLIDRKIIPG